MSATGFALSIGQLLRTPVRRNPDQSVHDGQGASRSYARVHASIDRLAAALSRLGLGPGMREVAAVGRA